MNHRPLGGTGIQVSTLALGTMMFGAWGNPDPAECRRMVDLALDAGVNLFDTADIYDDGRSEEILGDALQGRRDNVVLATKFGNPMGADPNRRGASRRWIIRAVEDSLRRLRTDRIDLYQLHRPDPRTDLDETLEALDDLVRAGKVLAIGTSCFPASSLERAAAIATDRGLTRFRSEQPRYSLFDRAIDLEILPTAARLGMGVLVWAPLDGGWLTGKYRRNEEPEVGSRAAREPDHFDHRFADVRARKLDQIDALNVVAADAGLSLPALALGFVRSRPEVTAALLGPRTPAQLAELLPHADVHLDADTLAAIDTIAPAPPPPVL